MCSRTKASIQYGALKSLVLLFKQSTAAELRANFVLDELSEALFHDDRRTIGRRVSETSVPGIGGRLDRDAHPYWWVELSIFSGLRDSTTAYQ